MEAHVKQILSVFRSVGLPGKKLNTMNGKEII